MSKTQQTHRQLSLFPAENLFEDKEIREDTESLITHLFVMLKHEEKASSLDASGGKPITTSGLWYIDARLWDEAKRKALALRGKIEEKVK